MKGILLLVFCLAIIFSSPASSKEYTVGQEETFWQFDVVKGGEVFEEGYYQTKFVCKQKGLHTYLFLEKKLKPEAIPSDNFMDSLVNRFDWLYPTLSEYFGPASDLDNNGRFIILVSDIRDWFFHGIDVPSDVEPILGYYWFPFNLKQQSDYLTMDCVQPMVDAYGTLAHEFFHNIYDNANPEPAKISDRAVNEALAHYAIFLNGTMDMDAYCQWQISILRKDLAKNKLLNPFDGSHDYFDISNPDIHHCYAAGYYFIHYIADSKLTGEDQKKSFFQNLIYENKNASSSVKLLSSLKKLNMISNNKQFNDLYNKEFKDFLKKLFKLN